MLLSVVSFIPSQRDTSNPVQKKCPLSVVGRLRYIEKYFKDFMKENFRSIEICPLLAPVRISRVSVRTGFPVAIKTWIID